MSLVSTLSPTKLFGETFKQRMSGWIGIDIGSSAIKIAQIQKEAESWILLNHKTIPLYLNDDQPDIALSATEAIQQQPSLFSLFSGMKAACLLPMSLVELQTLKLPEGTDNELRAMIQQELETLNNGQTGDKEFVFWEEKFTPNQQEGMIGLSVMSASQSDILTISQQLLKSSCHCEVMDVLPFALARAIKMISSSTDEPVAAFDWGTSTPLFIIVKNGLPVFSRVFRNCGYSNLTQILCDNMGLNLQESQHLLKQFQSKNPAESSMNDVRQAIADMVAAPLKQLSREFGKTLEFVKQQRPELLPKHLWLFGTGASLSSAEQVITDMTHIPSTIWSLPSTSNQHHPEQVLLQAALGPAIALSSLIYEI